MTATEGPRYRQIADDLRRRIAAGEWPIGSAIPSISALQQEYDVSGLNTVRSAQKLLQEEGLLEPRQGYGTFVIAAPPPQDPARAGLLAIITELRRALDTSQAALATAIRRLDELADIDR
ncbi:GntR family transcriptional regulator [Pseudonocardia dioxanivorans]|uniref:GntR family transcriptional regulator n=1 Tax=Pseudonocardia dioxanivorans TaxID=240495 RepID=UPI000CD1236C|nr:GntR family transcriptional regulator [Pseudonocardia dioxanivorans]